jgi:putative ABC transport system permease protein
MEQSKPDDKVLRRALRTLSWYCPAHLREEIEGDLVQRFQNDVAAMSRPRATRRLIWNTLCYCRPGILMRRNHTSRTKGWPLLASHFRFAWRGIVRSKVFSFINIAGLAIGMTAFLTIVQYTSFETSFDTHHQDHERIFRLAFRQQKDDGTSLTSAKNFIGIRSLLEENFPEVEAHTGFWRIPANTDFVFRYNGRVYMEPGNYIFADSNFLKVFPVLEKGNAQKVLGDAHNLIISQRLARKVFGDDDPLGKQIEDIVDPNDDGTELVVGGVMRDFPENSHFHADLLSYMGHEWDTATFFWDTPSFYTYAKVRPGTDVRALTERLNTILEEKASAIPRLATNQVFLQPLSSIHLEGDFGDEYERNGSRTLTTIMALIGLAILVIAWINYINLETARFLTRTKEIGIRRVIGSSRLQIAMQFVVRYICMSAAALAISIALLYLLVPKLGVLTGIELHTVQWSNPAVLLTALVVFFVGSVIVAAYPAVMLTRLRPAEAIKGTSLAPDNRFLRKGLVTFQFTVSLVLIALMLVIYKQVDFMRLSNKKIGIGQVVALKNAFAYVNEEFDVKQTEFKALQTKLAQAAPVHLVSSSSAIPGTEIGFTLVNEIHRHKGDPYDPTRFKLLFMDYNFIPMYGLKFLAGRNYQETDPPENIDHIILNQTAVLALGFESAEEAIGQKVHFPLWQWMSPDTEIIGVLEDYHHEAIKKPVMPTIFFLNLGAFQQVYYSIKLEATSDPSTAIDELRRAWIDIFPDRPFEYFFLDEYYDRQFKSEIIFGRIFTLFSLLAIALCCLGILGMTIFEANARLKEISIRKTLGASVANLLALLSRDHLRVMALSGIIAVPLIWWGARQWLDNYPVHIPLALWFFVTPLAIVGLVLVVTSGFQTLRAAQTNPVDHLKQE